MGIKTRIEFNHKNDSYYPGDLLSGKIILKVDEPIYIKSVFVRFRGSADVRWTQQDSRQMYGTTTTVVVPYVAWEHYFDDIYRINLEPDEHNLLPGENAFDFYFYLPVKIPSSYSGRYGRVYYRAIGYVEQPNTYVGNEGEVEKEFIIVHSVDLNINIEAKKSVNLVMESAYTYCCRTRPIVITANAPFSGYCAGQVVLFDVMVDNDTKFEIKNLTIALRQQVTYHSQEPKGKFVEPHVELASVVKRTIRHHTYRKFYMELKMPSIMAVNLRLCSLIDMEYSLKMSYELPACNDGDYDEAKFVIGNQPATILLDEQFKHPLQHMLPQTTACFDFTSKKHVEQETNNAEECIDGVYSPCDVETNNPEEFIDGVYCPYKVETNNSVEFIYDRPSTSASTL